MMINSGDYNILGWIVNKVDSCCFVLCVPTSLYRQIAVAVVRFSN